MDAYYFTLKVTTNLRVGGTVAGSTSFTTNATSITITNANVTASSFCYASPAVAPGAGEQLGCTPGAGYFVVFRQTGTTSGLAFQWLALNP
jgi:hypothetical protein